MKRWSAGLLLFGCALVGLTLQTQAGEFFQRHQRLRAQYPPRYTRGSMKQYYVFRDRYGNVQVREVYPGYAEHFPPPAYLFYGYPKSGDDTGLGF